MIEISKQTTHHITLTMTDEELYDFICLVQAGFSSRNRSVKRASERLQSISSLLDSPESTSDVDR